MVSCQRRRSRLGQSSRDLGCGTLLWSSFWIRLLLGCVIFSCLLCWSICWRDQIWGGFGSWFVRYAISFLSFLLFGNLSFLLFWGSIVAVLTRVGFWSHHAGSSEVSAYRVGAYVYCCPCRPTGGVWERLRSYLGDLFKSLCGCLNRPVPVLDFSSLALG